VRSLAAVADEIILVVRAGQTRPQDLELATTTLGDAAARIRGVVLNAAE
jgi:Mrp family chromosome partitioning ATPase